MAKKTTKPAAAPVAAPAPATTPAANSPADKAARANVAKGDRFIYVADPAKGAPQLKGIVNILKAAGTNGLTREELVQKMEGVITTRQPNSRILTYYTKEMQTLGAIRVIAATAPPVAAPAPASAPAQEAAPASVSPGGPEGEEAEGEEAEA